MNGIEDVFYKKKLIAKVFRADFPLEGVQFFTDENNPFQIGAHERKKGIALTPHVHRMEKPLTISVIQELLFIQRGKIKITIYTTKGKIIDEKILTSGDSILLMEEGHGVEFLEDSRIFEVKQGPYPGTTHAKLYIT